MVKAPIRAFALFLLLGHRLKLVLVSRLEVVLVVKKGYNIQGTRLVMHCQ